MGFPQNENLQKQIVFNFWFSQKLKIQFFTFKKKMNSTQQLHQDSSNNSNIYSQTISVIIILGGSGFVGRELCEKWPKHKKQGENNMTKVFTINRGNVYWGKPLNAPMIDAQIKGNRRDQQSMNQALEQVIEHSTTGQLSSKNIQLIIIDFSSDDEDDITRTQNALNNILIKTKQSTANHEISLLRYILISTDSVYADPVQTHDDENSISELDRIRSDPNWRVSETNFRLRKYISISDLKNKSNKKILKEAFSYSARKRRIEECIFSLELQERSETMNNDDNNNNNAVLITRNKITSLRMADVIGAFDDTNRFWGTQLWCEYILRKNDCSQSAENLKKLFSEHMKIDAIEADRLISFTTSWDMIRLIWSLIDRVTMQQQQKENFVLKDDSSSASSSKISGVFNVACVEPISVRNLIKRIFYFVAENDSNNENDDDTELDSDSDSSSSSSSGSSSDDEDATCDFYPSVSCGPLNVDAAISCLGWNPMKLNDAIDRTCEFFADRKLRKLKDEFRKGALRKLPLAKMREMFLARR